MQVTVLGKSPSWQDAAGACSGYLVQEGELQLLLDCGNGVFSKLRSALDYRSVGEVLISHLHADHFLDLVPFSYALANAVRSGGSAAGQGLCTPARRCGVPAGGHELLRRIVGSWGSADLIDDAFEITEYASRRRAHPRSAAGPLSRGAPLRPLARGRARDRAAGGHRFVFGADCAPNPALVEFAREADLLMVEATLPTPELGPERGHMTPREAGEHGAAARARRLVLTHFSDEMDPSWAAAEAADSYGGRVELAHEGAVYDALRLRVRLSTRGTPMPDRDLFASFDRMRREMDEMFGDAFGRSGLSRRRTGHWPPIDVAYASDPPPRDRHRRAGRGAVLGHRVADRGPAADPRRPPPRRPASRARSTSRSRSSAACSGGSSNSAPRSSPTRPAPATRTGCCGSSCRCVQRTAPPRQVPIETGEGGRADDPRRRSMIEIGSRAGSTQRDGRRDRSAADAARSLRGAAAARRGHLPRADGAAQHRPGAVGRADQRRAAGRPLAGARRRARRPRSRRPAPSRSTTSACSARSRGWFACPTTRCGSWSRAASASTSTSGCRPSRISPRRSPSSPTRCPPGRS